MDFGKALEALKEGKKVARRGWNGKGMFAVYQKGYPQGISCNKQTAEAWGLNEGDMFKVRPYLQLKTAQGDHAMWSPSTSDVLADDWEVVDMNRELEIPEKELLQQQVIEFGKKVAEKHTATQFPDNCLLKIGVHAIQGMPFDSEYYHGLLEDGVDANN